MSKRRRLLAERLQQERQQRGTSPHPVKESSQSLQPNPPSTTAGRPTVSSDRETSAPPAVGRGEIPREELSGRQQGHNDNITEMEQRLVDNLWSNPSHVSTSASYTGGGATTCVSSTPTFHHSYHGESADQLRDRSRPTPSWDTRRYNYTGAYGAQPFQNRPSYPPPIHPQAIQTSPSPPCVASPSPTPLPTPHIPPAGTNSPRHHIQPQSSQEWTEYMSAPADSLRSVSGTNTGSSNTTFSPTSSTYGTSHRGLDSSKFDLNHS